MLLLVLNGAANVFLVGGGGVGSTFRGEGGGVGTEIIEGGGVGMALLGVSPGLVGGVSGTGCICADVNYDSFLILAPNGECDTSGVPGE